MTRAPAIVLSGLESCEGEVAFAFVVLKFRRALRRDRLISLIRYLAALVPDPDAVIDGLPETVDDLVSVVALPWTPPRLDDELRVQRRLIESAGELEVEAARFFQAPASLPLLAPQHVRFPVDDYPPDTFDSDAFGIAFKLAGSPVPGTRSVLAAFHGLWLAAYRGQLRDAAMTYDQQHHAAQLSAELVTATPPPEQLAGHAIWVASKIDEVFPLLHARLGGASGSSVVLGGNPLRVVYDEGGEPAVDRWLADQTEWSTAEIARMLCAVARDILGTAKTPG